MHKGLHSPPRNLLPRPPSSVAAAARVERAIARRAVLLPMLSGLARLRNRRDPTKPRATTLTGGGTPLLQTAASPCEPRLPRVSPAELQAKAMRLPSSTVPQSWIPWLAPLMSQEWPSLGSPQSQSASSAVGGKNAPLFSPRPSSPSSECARSPEAINADSQRDCGRVAMFSCDLQVRSTGEPSVHSQLPAESECRPIITGFVYPATAKCSLS